MILTILKPFFCSRNIPVFKICKLTKWWRLKVNQFLSAMMKKVVSQCVILCNKILISVLHNMNTLVLLPWQYTWFQNLPDIKSFAGRLWRFIFIFANDPSSAWSSKQLNMLGRVFCGLLFIYVFILFHFFFLV